MEWNDTKTKKYISNPPVTVHGYTKLTKGDSPRAHSSPTSILRKFPHSLRHDQKHQTKIKRNSVPTPMLISERMSWCIGDESFQQCAVAGLHKSTPDLSQRSRNPNNKVRGGKSPSDTKVPFLKSSDSLPQLNQFKNKFLNNLIPKLSQTINESNEVLLINKLRHIDSCDSVQEDEKVNLLSDVSKRKVEVSGSSCASVEEQATRELKKCETVVAISNLLASNTQLHVEAIKPINRLRVPPNNHSGTFSRMCSRCSSLLSMASSSRYSINTTGSGFVPCYSSDNFSSSHVVILCKLCLMEVPVNQSMEIHQCGCTFCRDCMRLYAEFEIQEGAYDISCPDAQCENQGVVTLDEVQVLVTSEMMDRYKRFRLNREVDLDRNRTWCPRAGCETVCDICPREKCLPASVLCPTCESNFCSNCKNPWHQGLTCEENSKKLAREGRGDLMEPNIPFDSDVIKFCPMCNVPIEKDEGCAQMMCKRCKHVFCWYCLASLDDDFLLRHYDKGPCKNKLGHSRASVIWHRTQVIGIFAGFGILLLVASPLLLLAAPCIVCCKCRVCSGGSSNDDDLPEESVTAT